MEKNIKEYDWEEIYKNAMQNFMQTFVTPEVIRRQDAGKLPKPFNMQAAQIIFFPDGRKPDVRLNSEVKALAKMKLKPGIPEKNYGDPVFANELDGLEELMLTPDDDLDSGHVTIIKLNGNWMLAFDFTYNRALAKKHIETAKQYIENAQFSFSHKYWSAFVDNLFSAAELLAKAVLLASWSDPHFREKTTHAAIHSRYNKFANLGNVDPLHADAYNKLSKLRYPARYLKSDFTLSESEAESILKNINQMLDETIHLTRIDKMPPNKV